MPSDDLPLWLQRHRWAIGARVRTHRHAADLSQVELATIAGIDHKTVSRIENGVTATDIDQLARIAAALRIPSAALLPDDHPPAPLGHAADGRP